MRVPCNVVYDLLPLYIDGACSEESKELVKEHLTGCSACRERQAAMTSEMVEGSLIQPSDNQPTLINRDLSAKRVLKRMKRRWTLSAAALLLLVPFIWLGMNQYRGEGVSYTNLYDHYSAYRFIHNIEEGNYEEAFSYVNVKYYYESLQEGLPIVTKELRKEDFQYRKLEDGKFYYTNESTKIPEENNDEWLRDRNEYYNKNKDLTYEQFYAFKKSDFIRQLQQWGENGYKISGFGWDSAYDNGDEVNNIDFNVHVRDRDGTTRTGVISLGGNNKGKFIVGGGSYLIGDAKRELLIGSLLSAISVTDYVR